MNEFIPFEKARHVRNKISNLVRKISLSGFTLVELLIVSMILGILLTLAVIYHTGSKEDIFDQEVISKLVLLQSAEKNYYLELGTFYPSTGDEDGEAAITQNLKVFLPAGANRVWDYLCEDSGCLQALRNGGDARSWRMCISEPNPVAGDTCPDQGGTNCP